MAKIAVVVIPFWGHVNVTLSVGQKLIEKGHTVKWFMPLPLKGMILPKGGEISFTNENNTTKIQEFVDRLEACKSKPALEGTKYVIDNVLIPIAKEMFAGLCQQMQRFLPDLIINDEQTYAGAFCAHKLNFANITSHAPPSGIFEESNLDNIKDWYFNSMTKLQQELGVESDELHYMSKDLGLAFSPKEFADTSNLMPQQIFVGPCIDSTREYNETFDFERIKNGKKNILVSIGTLLTAEAKRFYTQVVQEFTNSNYNIIVTTTPEIFESWPANFIVQNRIPYLEIYKHIDVIITHGGANTVCDSIGMGIPLIVIPMAYDQYYVGDQVALNKLGFRFKYKRLKNGTLINTVNTLLEKDNIYKTNVLKYSEIFKNAGGATKATHLIEEYLQSVENKKVFETIIEK